MFGHAVKIGGHAALAAAAALLAIGLAPAPLAAAVDAQALVGSWAGPPTLGDTDDCGAAAGVFAFSPNGVYRYVAGSEACMVMIDGRYELQADGGVLQLSIDECGSPGCPPGPSTMTVTATGPDTIVLNGQPYLRQHG